MGNAGAFVLMALIWGGTWAAVKVGVTAVPPIFFAFPRYALVGAILAAMVCRVAATPHREAVSRACRRCCELALACSRLKLSADIDLTIEIIEHPLQMRARVLYGLIVDRRAQAFHKQLQDQIGAKFGERLVEFALIKPLQMTNYFALSVVA